ncbi:MULTISPECIES: hypothetical protein [Calothrix]|uniref:Uncharacterized protein n=2 Tax=Calothrix TaxID=1186 RepID=A0ABR8ANE6_9CYAN|nr:MULTISPECIES: hypothetical protein [Calothrix]MBD2200152.1 hypothetical protein [Calothrix parietina FACHB-288]MBD2229138.1 hypothetical protein [Calothrix anomala FACHB-343]
MDSFERNINTNEQAQEQSIQSQNFGGLNTTASPLNTPYEDSPYLLNTIVDISGNVHKRKGTRLLYRSVVESYGNYITGFTTGLNYNLVVCKRGTDLLLFEVLNDVVSLVMTKANVWDNSAKDIKPSTTSTSEVEPRLIMCTGVNKPVQLLFTEQQAIQTSTSTSIAFTNAARFINASSSNCLVFVNRVKATGVTFSYSSGTLTLSNLPNTVNGDVIDIVLITWQWWAEAQAWKGDRFFKSTSRFNSTATDQNVKVPDSLITDLSNRRIQAGEYNLIPYKNSKRAVGAAYTKSSTRQPSTADEFAFGDGSIYVYNTNNQVNPSPYYLTFGALQSPSDASTVYINRRRDCKFNNNTALQAQYFDVYVDNSKSSVVYSSSDPSDAVYGSCYAFNDDTGTLGTSNSSLVHGITFEAYNLGIAATSTIEVANNQIKHIGSSAVNTLFNYNDGSYVMVYGLGNTADYNNGFYPSVVSIYQNRLVFSGFTHRPLTILFSNIDDSVVPSKYYMSFSITDDSQLITDAFDVVINSRPDDRVVALVEWQASLFVLTRYACFRLTGGNQPLSPSSRFVNFVSNTGIVNANCWARTDFSVLYLSDTGLYDLTPLVENGEYQVRERSIKIRDKFGLTKDPLYEELPWVRYDSSNRLVYVGYPAPSEIYTTRYLYVYNTFRESWTEFNTPTGFNIWSASEYVDRTKGTQFGCVCCSIRNNSRVPQDFILLRFNDVYYLDFVQQKIHNGTSYYCTPRPSVTHTVSYNQRRYGANYALTNQVNAFTTFPITEVEDLTVIATLPTTEAKTLVWKTDYLKEESGYIYLLKPLPDNTVLSIYLGGQIPKSHLVVYVNNLKIESPTPSNNSFTLSINNGDQVVYGNVYLTAYATPTFLWNNMANLKRTQHAYLFFDNREGILVYDAASAINGQDSNTITERYVLPINANLTVTYNNQLDGSTSYDIFGFRDIYWDDAVFDITTPTDQAIPYQILKFPITGIGVSYQIMVWNYSEEFFKLSGYQIVAKMKGRRWTSKY